MEKYLKCLLLLLILIAGRHFFSPRNNPPADLAPQSVGLSDEEEDIADNSRDRNIPMLYDKNKRDLMEKRDRRIRKEGRCCPPPDVYTSPNITRPPLRQTPCR